MAMINDNEKELLLQDLRRYLAAHYTPKKFTRGTPFLGAEISAGTLDVRSLRRGGLTSATKNAILQGIRQMLRPGFRALLFELAKKKGVPNVEIYRRSDLTKAHFSKIKNDDDYHPSKETVLALAIGLKLTLDETKRLLERAGYTLTDSSKTDLIVQYFIERQRYDVAEVNEALDAFGLPTITNHRKSRERKDGW